MTNENQANNQANNQINQEELQKASEFKTVVNGKVVTLKEAQMAEQRAAQQAEKKTGIQAQHDNNTQAVEAGQMASGTSMSQTQETLNMKQVNVQSGQAHLDQHMNQAQPQAQPQAKAAKTTKKVD